MSKARAILSYIGVNRTVFYFLLGKGFSFAATPLTLYFIATFFTAVEQGYYYTFSSLLSLSIFFELGLGVVITQFASHEFAHLSWKEDGSLQGDPAALTRLLSLVRKSLKWYAVIMFLCIAVILPAGIIFMNSKPESADVAFMMPWILLIVFFGINTSFIPFLSALEGCGMMAQVQKLRFVQSVAGVMAVWAVLVGHGKLLASSIEFIAYFAVLAFWIVLNYRGFMMQILRSHADREYQISWFREIFPMQWRIAVSWLSAYFTNYLFTPLLFAFRGPVEAGKMGMSLKLSGIVFTLSMAWINARVPLYGALIAKKNYEELDHLSLRTTSQAAVVGMIFSVCVVVGLGYLNAFSPKYAGRALPEYVVGILCLASVASMVNAAIGGYLRAHKEEPLMVNSIIVALIVAATSYAAARYSDANVMALAYAGCMITVALPLFLRTLSVKRSEWHGGSAS